MKKKNRTQILIYLIIAVVIVYWFSIFHSSSTLRKVATNGIGNEEYNEFDQQVQSDSMAVFKFPELSAEALDIQLSNKDLDDKVSSIINNGGGGGVNENDLSRLINNSQIRSMTNAMGLTFMKREFFLNGKPFRIFSGSIHYFRVPPGSWKDRLLKLKACGLNTVETYVPWNLHEPSPGVYNFEGILDLRSFIKTAGELGLYVIFRPGPYICSEMDFGGLPGWLLGDSHMKVRSNYKGYIKHVVRYFTVMIQKVTDLQFTEGGPIIMVQVENEYGVYGEDIGHLKLLTFMLRNAGIRELLVTSDNKYNRQEMYFHEYALPTSNAAKVHPDHYEKIMSMNKHFPFMIMELWTGWFTTWGERYKAGRSIADLNSTIQQVLNIGGSFNLYMFHGGTNFGFSSGAVNESSYKSMITSYDYDALLTESGDITAKYMAVRDIMKQFYKTIGINNLPPVPSDTPKKAYGRLRMEEKIEWKDFIENTPITTSANTATFMERYRGEYPVFGLQQSTLGYVVYSHPNIKYMWDSFPGIQIIGHVRDRLLGVISNKVFSVLHGKDSEIDPRLEYDWDTHFSPDNYEFYWDHGLNYDEIINRHDWKRLMGQEMLKTVEKLQRDVKNFDARLDLIVENQGRVGYSSRVRNLLNGQNKGIKGPVFNFLRGQRLMNWKIRFITFNAAQCLQISNSTFWTKIHSKESNDTIRDKLGHRIAAPTLFRTSLTLDQEPQDTFIHMQGWIKGVIIVNKFNLGRYWNIGPQTALYLPSSLLHRGVNEILIFEEERHGDSILLSAQPSLGVVSPFK